MDYFDDSTYEPERLMYWPSTPSDGEYIYKAIDGEVLDPDTYLAKLSDWRDCSLWPTSSRQSEIIKREITRQQDPLEKEGVVGAFCRAYPIEDAIAEFLPDVYEPLVVGGRYDYIPADSSAGVVLYDGKFSYSHHASDPACGRLLNSFDLVRVHKFADMDEKKSFKAMNEFAVANEKVNAILLIERRESATLDFAEEEDWTRRLQREKSGELTNNLHNIRLILENDPNGTASWVDEGAAIPESDDKFGQVNLGAHKLATMLKISEELLNDSAFNMEQYTAKEFGRRIGRAEEEAFITGNGTGRPTGFLSTAQVGVTTAGAAAITLDEVIDLYHSLREPYRRNAVFIMNDLTVKAIRKLKDNTGQYLWQPSLIVGAPDTVLGRPIRTSSFMPEIKASAKTVAFGDFSYFWIADRQGRAFRRLNELYAATGQVGFLASQRVDGKLILPEAVKVLAQKSS